MIGKFRKGDIVKSIDEDPVAVYWRNCTFEVIKESDPEYGGYRLRPLDPPSEFSEEDVDYVYADEDLLYFAIDKNDINWWVNK